MLWGRGKEKEKGKIFVVLNPILIGALFFFMFRCLLFSQDVSLHPKI